jgi:hypothetical protein
MPKLKKGREKIEIEPGADERLAKILKKALSTPAQHKPASGPKSPKSKKT